MQQRPVVDLVVVHSELFSPRHEAALLSLVSSLPLVVPVSPPFSQTSPDSASELSGNLESYKVHMDTLLVPSSPFWLVSVPVSITPAAVAEGNALRVCSR